MVRILDKILGCLKRKSDSGALLTLSLARICFHSSNELAQVSFGRGVASCGGGYGRGWSVLFVDAIKFSLLAGGSRIPREMFCILSQFSFIVGSDVAKVLCMSPVLRFLLAAAHSCRPDFERFLNLADLRKRAGAVVAIITSITKY